VYQHGIFVAVFSEKYQNFFVEKIDRPLTAPAQSYIITLYTKQKENKK